MMRKQGNWVMLVPKGMLLVVLLIPHVVLLAVHDSSRWVSDRAYGALDRYDDLVKRPAGWAYGMGTGK